MYLRHSTLLSAVVAAGLSLAAGAVDAQVIRTTTVVADTTTAVPGGNGSFSRFGSLTLNDEGQAAFVGTLTGTSGGFSDDNGIFLGDGTMLRQLAREGQVAPDNNGSLSDFGAVALNDAGQVAFRGALIGTSGGLGDNLGIFRGDGTTLTQVVRWGQAAPDNNGSFAFLSVRPALNDAGQVAFVTRFIGTSGASRIDNGIFRSDGTTLTQIARTGQALPSNNGSFAFLSSTPTLNDAGQVAFVGDLTGTSGGAGDASGVFIGNGTVLTQVARAGQAVPDNNGVFAPAFFDPAFNNAGQAVFVSRLNGTNGGLSDDRGIFLGDGTTLTRVARQGQAAPDNNGSFQFLSVPSLDINDVGHVAFRGFLTGTSGGSEDNLGLFCFDGQTLTQVARKGQAAPTSDGMLEGVLSSLSFFPNLNDLGQLAFLGGIDLLDDEITSDELGLFIFDNKLGLTSVVRTGDAFDGSTITDIDFFGRDDYSSLNNLSQVAYGYTLADGRSGVAITSISSVEVDPFVLGDCNQDGMVDFGDISPFIDLLISESYLDEGDCNRDDVVDFLDVLPFISILIEG